MTNTKFPLGKLVITPNAKAALDELDATGLSEMFIALMGRHAQGDWGEISDDSKEANDASVENGGDMILSAYTIGGTRFWIITEHDRSATTILLPEDY